MATIASPLRERVALQVNSVDRIFLAGYIPKHQSEGLLSVCALVALNKVSPG